MNHSVDHPKGYVGVEYLKFAADLMRRFKERTCALMQVEAGQRVLDVGCGPGTDTLPLAQLVGPTGQAVGVDYDREMETQAIAAGVVTAAEVERWRASLEQAAAQGEFYGTGAGALIAGRRPAS